MQWADATSLDLVRSVQARACADGLLVAYRPEELDGSEAAARAAGHLAHQARLRTSPPGERLGCDEFACGPPSQPMIDRGVAVPDPDRPPLHCDAHALVAADLDTVGALAYLALLARRMGCRLVLRHVPDRLQELLELAGLSGPDGVLVVETEGQAEHGEHAVGVEEEREPDDPPV